MKHFEYWWNADGQFILSDRCIRKAEDAFRGNDEQPLLDILEETAGKPLPANLSKLLSDILTGKVKRRKGVAKKFALTHNDIVRIGCMVRDIRASGVKRNDAVRDVAEFLNPTPEFAQTMAELDPEYLSSVTPGEFSLTTVKLAYAAFQKLERNPEKSPSTT